MCLEKNWTVSTMKGVQTIENPKKQQNIKYYSGDRPFCKKKKNKNKILCVIRNTNLTQGADSI